MSVTADLQSAVIEQRICNPHHPQVKSLSAASLVDVSDCKSDTSITPDYKSGVTGAEA